TKGGQSLKGLRRHPTIGDHVTIYAGASILGGATVVGANATIGSNAFVTESVAPGARVSIKNPELSVRQPKEGAFHDHS
ncbi:MAG: serine acetyltransferase, partial [Bacillota bacterium]|nr:serine acetyltransferase [Bacillota bacterium]